MLQVGVVCSWRSWISPGNLRWDKTLSTPNTPLPLPYILSFQIRLLSKVSSFSLQYLFNPTQPEKSHISYSQNTTTPCVFLHNAPLKHLIISNMIKLKCIYLHTSCNEFQSGYIFCLPHLNLSPDSRIWNTWIHFYLRAIVFTDLEKFIT